MRNDTLDELERRRLELEENVQKLRQSLYNWRLWEAEYDGLKDEVKTLHHDSTQAEIIRLGIDFEGTVVDEKEVKALVGEGQGVTRSRDQVVQQISRRLDYVKQNVVSIEKRLGAAEADLDRLLSVERPGPNAATEHYAVTEIFEELDDNGEVISSRISNPADRAPEIEQMLKKAGVEVPQSSEPETEPQASDNVNGTESKIQALDTAQDRPQAETTQPPVTQTNQEQHEPPTAGSAVTTVKKMETEDSDDSDSEAPIAEVEESAEDARLRREMLEYSFHEVGKVVAELEMDEEGSDVSYDDDDYDDDYEDEDEDEYGRTTGAVLTEDYHQQMKELEERLKSGGFINLGPASNLTSEANATAETAAPAGVLKVAHVENIAEKESPLEEKKKPKKKVAFADELDIAAESKPVPVPAANPERKIEVLKPDVAPLSDSIVERSTSEAKTPIGTKNATEPTPAKKKASRFKAARKKGTPTPGDSITPGIGAAQQSSILKKSDQPPTPSSVSLFPAKPQEPKPFSQPIIAGDVFAAVAAATESPANREPQPPKDKITADTLVERPVVDKTNVLPPDPDEIDEEIHRKEIASEFYHRRNNKIQQSGGFLQDDDEEEDPLYELDENDKPKRKVSKFKAARLRP